MTHATDEPPRAGLETLPHPATAAAAPRRGTDPAFRARFTRGSVLRHVLVMTATGTVGTLSIFAVDLLSLVYVSHLGSTELKAAAGFATQVLVYPVAINIGLTIAVTAAVSRALGADHRARAKRIAASGLLISGAVSTLVAAAALAGAGPLLSLFGAQGHVREVAECFLLIALPGNVPFALGMALSGVLRAVGDARRAMMVTLAGGLVTAAVDPLLIFGLNLGIYGAAVSTLLSRFVFLGVGLHGVGRVHGLLERPRPRALGLDARILAAVALPAIAANLATPVGNGYALHVYAAFGDAAVAASAVIDRTVYVAFAAVFALTGAVGPILGQNVGAGLYGRVRETLTRCFAVTVGYALLVWLALALLWPEIAALFQASPAMTDYLRFFCTWGVAAWLFIGMLFVANAAFNNLGFPLLATLFNWGRATLGTAPFVTLGAHLGGVEGGMVGMAAGAAIFGTGAVATAYRVVGRLGLKAAHR
ncbi:MATE family efflux transporter [Lichenibacterium dinghuense]|uniref:MATE family efflux transporter n=1 Tax=Lichenibacterium dinghuense TaxID=2895977 RepID=UPI001EFF0DBB|nr:MATE family efflux transporter [Lichenibacterium sp. 6Y81]